MKDCRQYTCRTCDIKFFAFVENRKYCSNECYWNASGKQRRTTKECLFCGGFTRNRKYCSHECYAEAIKGRTLSQEQVEKVREALKGRRPGNRLGAKLTKEQKVKLLDRTPWNKGGTHSETTKAKLKVKAIKQWRDPESRQTLVDSHIGFQHSEKTKERFREVMKERWEDPKYRTDMIEERTRRWKNPEYRENAVRRILQGNRQFPNKKELQLLSLLPNSWQYTGNGQLIVAGKCPDFWDGSGRLIELNGCYWHGCPVCGEGKECNEERDQDRIDLFKREGYNTLIVWEHELKDVDMITKKILSFSEEVII